MWLSSWSSALSPLYISAESNFRTVLTRKCVSFLTSLKPSWRLHLTATSLKLTTQTNSQPHQLFHLLSNPFQTLLNALQLPSSYKTPFNLSIFTTPPPPHIARSSLYTLQTNSIYITSAMKGVVVSILVMLVMSCVVLEPCRALTCGDVNSSLAPCVNYLSGKGAATAQCCSGVHRLNGLANNTANRRAACNCMKANAGRVKGLRYDLINQLPRRCGVGLSFTIDLNRCNSWVRFPTIYIVQYSFRTWLNTIWLIEWLNFNLLCFFVCAGYREYLIACMEGTWIIYGSVLYVSGLYVRHRSGV